ncbi:MAG: ATP-dependent sacrificial sulfur transferase LarE [Actinobacteria bacterium]|nr:ATP-dependent sacrificial sulfur transferase LarE [Actinomycetota bacterium]
MTVEKTSYKAVPTTLEEKIKRLKEILTGMKSVVVAFSGGVDSSLLLKLAIESLGKNVIAVTAKSPTFPEREIEEATKIARMFGCKHMIINSNELQIEEFKTNPKNRCYYCKKELFSNLISIKNDNGFDFVVDGTNFDDSTTFRPGMQASKELGIRSPLLESSLTKQEIREYSKEIGLPTWDRPAFACLASRIPYGQKITSSKLRKIEEAESFLLFLGFKQVRVRYHEPVARIEVEKDKIPEILDKTLREKIIAKLKEIGFKYITIDLEGYRSGSMDE